MTAASYMRGRAFWIGLGVKLACVIYVAPAIQTKWFVPFITSIFNDPSLTPWASFLARFHDTAAFPYGPIMLLAHLPFVLVGWIMAGVTEVEALPAIGFRLSLLAADFGVLLALTAMFAGRERQVVWFYWLSPIVFFVTYIHGQTDIVPLAFFTLSLLLFQREQFVHSGVALALAVSAKFSMLIVAPFYALYLFKSKKYRYALGPFLIALAAPAALIQSPFLLDSGFREMVMNTREVNRLYDLAATFSGGVSLYLAPLLLLLLFYSIWRIARMNFDLLVAVTALGFFLLVLASPAPPGWYVWLVPFLVIHQLRHRAPAILLVSGLSVAFVAYYAATASGAAIPLFGMTAASSGVGALSERTLSQLYTVLFALGLVIAVQIGRVGIRENDYYRLTRRPLAIGVGGDSGSGKDAFAQAIIGLFGAHSTTHLSGDDYHIWDRHNPMWSGLTHLNPRTNRLLEYTSDSLNLIRRRGIIGRRYDHSTGRFTKLAPIASNDIVILSGLHVFFLSTLRNQLDVRFFLDMDENLRRYFKLRRDTRERGHDAQKVLAAIEARASDAEKYIRPQRELADTVLSLIPVNQSLLDLDGEEVPPLKLRVTVRRGGYYEDLAKVLIGVCNLYISLEMSAELGVAVMEIESYADFKGEDAALAAQILCPRIRELLDVQPKWRDGMLGVMQVIALTAVNESLMRRQS